MTFLPLFLFLEYAQLFAALIARTAKDVDVLIDSLPSEESTAALQVSMVTHPHFLTEPQTPGTTSSKSGGKVWSVYSFQTAEGARAKSGKVPAVSR